MWSISFFCIFVLFHDIYGFDVQNEVTDCVYRAKYEQKYNKIEEVARDCFKYPHEIVQCIQHKRRGNPELTAQQLGFACITDLPGELRECWKVHHDVQLELWPVTKECETLQQSVTPTQLEKIRKLKNVEQRLFEGRSNAVPALVEETGVSREVFECLVRMFNLNDKFVETFTKCQNLEKNLSDPKDKIAAVRMYELFRYYTS